MLPSFEHWLPNSSPPLIEAVRNCSVPLQMFKEDPESIYTQRLCQNVFDCVMGGVDETNTYLYQSAGVLIGLTPTALSLIGNSTAEISLLSSVRPVLSSLIAIAAPTIVPFHSFRYKNPLKDLKLQQDPVPYPQLRNAAIRHFISAVEYVIVIAAAGNVAHLAYQLSTSSVYIPNCEITCYPYLWTYIAYPIHLHVRPSLIRDLGALF